MVNLLVKLFVKNPEKIEDDTVRESYGSLSSFVGIFCNIILFIAKFIMGTLSNSIAITSDAFNNLSDCMSCIITLFGYKLAAKPADKDHPFGHGRIEYIVSFIVSMIIIFVGVELFKTSVEKILSPSAVSFSWVALTTLVLSILVKLWMSYLNKTLGNKIHNIAMLATSKDSFNDVLATLATAVALIGSSFTTLPLDGCMGVVVSVFILFSGYGIIRDTVDELVGQPADPALVKQINQTILSKEGILGVHDMIIHNYGPGKLIGSAHAEVDSRANILEAHDTIDQIENEIAQQYHIMMTLHMDPIEQDNSTVTGYKVEVSKILSQLDAELSLHDFRIVSGPTHTNLVFDVVVPFECKIPQEQIKEAIDAELKKNHTDKTIFTVITFDRRYY